MTRTSLVPGSLSSVPSRIRRAQACRVLASASAWSCWIYKPDSVRKEQALDDGAMDGVTYMSPSDGVLLKEILRPVLQRAQAFLEAAGLTLLLLGVRSC